MDFKKLREESQVKYNNLYYNTEVGNNIFNTNSLDIIEEGLFDKFKKRKSDKKENENKSVSHTNPPEEKRYDGKKVKSDLNKIRNEIKKIIKEPGIKEFINNSISITDERQLYSLCGDDHSYFIAGVDEFSLFIIDLWDYKGGNPRELIRNSEDGWHPVDHAVYKLRGKIKELLKEKFTDFYLCEDGGDWDTSSIEIGLK